MIVAAVRHPTALPATGVVTSAKAQPPLLAGEGDG